MLQNIAVVLLVMTSISFLLSTDWRVTIGALALQYLAVFILVSVSWPIEMALIKLVVGWMAGAALGLTHLGQKNLSTAETSWPASRLFRLFAAGLVVLTIFSILPNVDKVLPGIGAAQTRGGLILIGLGLLQLGMTAHPFRVIIGLLTVLAGFEILYAAVEVSVMVAGLLAGVNLGLALVGVYLLNLTSGEEPA